MIHWYVSLQPEYMEANTQEPCIIAHPPDASVGVHLDAQPDLFDTEEKIHVSKPERFYYKKDRYKACGN